MSRDQEHNRNRRNRQQQQGQQQAQGQQQGRRDRNERQDRPHGQGSRREHFPEFSRQDFSAPKPVKRDYGPDPVNGKPIENVFQAFIHRDSREPVNFDTVLEQIKGSEHLGPGEFVCYIGAGNFAVYAERVDNGKKILELKKKIPYEDGHDKPQWRRDLSPGISRDYKPEPLTVSELYSREELEQFPRLGTGSGIYLPRNT